MCWVIPPASVSTTAASRIASSSVVLPWSTWPMIVTTGGRGARSSSASSKTSGSSSSSAACLIVISRLSSVPTSSTSSSESDCVICTIWPRPIMILMIWAAGTPSACERSRTETPDGTVAGPVGGATSCFSRFGARLAAVAGLTRVRAVRAALDHDAALPSGRALAGPDRAVRLVRSVSHQRPILEGV